MTYKEKIHDLNELTISILFFFSTVARTNRK